MYHAAPRSEVPRLPVLLPPRPTLLAGREELLTRVHTALTEGARPRMLILCGLGGAGKTSLAVEYAHRHLAEFGVAWQVSAEDPAIIAAGISELAAQIGAREVADLRDPVASAHAVLAAYPAEWLIVIDNAPDEASIRRFIPPAGRGQVLVTSQSQHWHGQQVLDVPMLDQEVAAEFLLNRTADPDQQSAVALAGEMGGLPLALEQAAAYIRATGSTLARFLALYQDRRTDLLDRGEIFGRPDNVVTTLRLALSRLENDAPIAATLLRLLACLAPEPMPLQLLLRPNRKRLRKRAAQLIGPLLDDPIQATDAVSALRRYSLITPAGDGMILMHRLVQAVAVDFIPDEEIFVWKQLASALVDSAVPAGITRPENWPVFAMLLPHAQAVLPDSSRGMVRIVRYLGESGNYRAARDLQNRVAAARWPVLGKDHRISLADQHRLARWTGEAGDPATARDRYADLLLRDERVLGVEHRTTLSTRSYLAFWTGEAGDPTAAREMFAKLLPLEEGVLGAEHAFTLSTRGNLARWTGEAGDAATAREMFAKLMPDDVQILGPEHRSTLVARDGLARWTGEAGDPVAARDMLTELVPDLERLLGPTHPFALAICGSLARWTGEAGDPATAREMLAKLLPDMEGILGPDNRNTLRSRAGLARWIGKSGNPALARDLLAELLPRYETALGCEHPYTVATRHQLAYWTGKVETG